jgi:predicted nucleic acid-binding Zn ribbon protein
VGWTVPSPQWGACHPVSTPSWDYSQAWLGVTIPCSSGFPEFGRIYQQIALLAALCSSSYQGYNAVMNNPSNCIVCGKSLHGRQTKFCSPVCKNKDLQSYEAQKRRGLARKLDLIKNAGGRCSICGYDKNLAALVFHHTASSDKDFKLDMRSLSNRRLDPVLEEINKCILVCANCHAELHNPRLNLDLLL